MVEKEGAILGSSKKSTSSVHIQWGRVIYQKKAQNYALKNIMVKFVLFIFMSRTIILT